MLLGTIATHEARARVKLNWSAPESFCRSMLFGTTKNTHRTVWSEQPGDALEGRYEALCFAEQLGDIVFQVEHQAVVV